MVEISPKWVENTAGKGEIAHLEQFLLVPKCSQKTCTANTYKPGLVWERVNFEVWSLKCEVWIFQTSYRLSLKCEVWSEGNTLSASFNWFSKGDIYLRFSLGKHSIMCLLLMTSKEWFGLFLYLAIILTGRLRIMQWKKTPLYLICTDYVDVNIPWFFLHLTCINGNILKILTWFIGKNLINLFIHCIDWKWALNGVFPEAESWINIALVQSDEWCGKSDSQQAET